jgi:hypothetical protein
MASCSYLQVNFLTPVLFPLISPELSASDDSSLSDGLLLEEGERNNLGTWSRLDTVKAPTARL